jgi:diaminopimelate epimerase
MKIIFTKMQGTGNDYLYFDCVSHPVEQLGDLPNLSKRVSDRHFGVGSDGIILILPSSAADFRMRMFNADGSEAEMCGNGIRCFARFVHDKGLTSKKIISVETKAGIKTVQLLMEKGKLFMAKVDMGAPILQGKNIPVAIDKEKIIEELIDVDGKAFKMTCVSMGNPHCIIFTEKITDELVLNIGPKIEKHPLFPKKTNVEFIEVVNRQQMNMRVWERGSGETLACGTGACAACVAAVLNDKTERKLTIHLLGGNLELEWANDNHVYMTGPAEFVFEGEIEV